MANDPQTEMYDPTVANGTAKGHAAWDETTPLDQRPLGWSIGRLITPFDTLSPAEEQLRRTHALYVIEHLGEDRDVAEQRETLDAVMAMLEKDPFRIE